MKYRKFGQLDWEVSALGYGCMRFPAKKFLFWKKVEEEEAIKLIRYGIDNGINYLDTAYSYHGGKSELIVGKALKDGYREKVKIATKLPMWKVKKTEDFDKFLHEQLEKLDLDYIDFYLFHGLNKARFETIKKLNLIQKMEEAKEKGLIKYICFSFHDNYEVFKDIVDYYSWDMCLIQHNYMDVGIQATSEGVKYAADKGLAVVIMEPLKGGKLANPPKEALELMKNAPVKRTPVDWALQFLWNKPEISCVLSGMGSMKMVNENIKSASQSGINVLSKEEEEVLGSLAEIFRKKILVQCSGCKYCQPCPNGVDISQIFNLLNEFSQSEGKKKFRKKYRKLISNKEDMKTAEENGNAALCTKCGQCLEQCPQEIEIYEELQKAHSVLAEKRSVEDVFGT